MAKDLGTISELAFMLEATKRGLKVSTPHSELHYDFVVDGNLGLFRVQVKSCHAPLSDQYQVAISFGSGIKKPYSINEIDLMAIHIMAEQSWYLIPVYELKDRKTIRIHPNKDEHEFSPFKNAWIF